MSWLRLLSRIGRYASFGAGSIELGELFGDLASREREVARIEDRLLSLAAEHVAQELLHRSGQRLSGLALQADVYVARERIATAGHRLAGAFDGMAVGIARHGQRLEARAAILESAETE